LLATARRPEMEEIVLVEHLDAARQRAVATALRPFFPSAACYGARRRRVRSSATGLLRIAPADGGGAARNRGAGAEDPHDLPCDGGTAGAAGRGHWTLRRRAAARRRSTAIHGEIHARGPRRSARARGSASAGRSPTRRSRKRPPPSVCTTRRIRRARSPALSAATSPRIPAACIA
jgi:hypothetical protein